MDGLGSFFTDFKAFILIYDYFLLNCNLDRTGTFLTCNLSMVFVEIGLHLTLVWNGEFAEERTYLTTYSITLNTLRQFLECQYGGSVAVEVS